MFVIQDGIIHGELKAVCVIDDIRLNIDTAIKAETAVAEDKDSQGQEDASDYDPMDELADFYQKTNAPKPKKGSKPKAKPRAKKADNRSRIMTLEMPKRPICAGGGEDKITISVYLKNGSKYVCAAKRSIWLNSSCIGWLIASLPMLLMRSITKVSCVTLWKQSKNRTAQSTTCMWNIR